MTHFTHPRRRPALFVGALTLVALFAGSVAACGGDDDTAGGVSSTTLVQSGALDVDGDGTTAVDPSTLAEQLEASPAGSPDADEVAALLYMVEEEKLALDVYTSLGSTWNLPTFTNIAGAEATHVDAVRALLDRFDLTDPTEGQAAGEFTDPTFDTLHRELTTQGQISEVEALKVGAVIEELDIVDLEARLAQTDEPAIVSVFENLQAGSRNHLRAFTRALDARGVVYQPGYLSASEYEAIVSAEVERGGRAR